MRFNFLAAFAGEKGKELADGMTKALVNLDPDAASEADLRVMEQDLDAAGKMLQKLRSELTQEQEAFDRINTQYTRMMGAAEVLQKQIDDPANIEKKASLEVSLNSLLVKIESMVTELDADKHDVSATQSLLAETETAYKEKADALVHARQNLDRAKHDLQHASLEESRAKQRANTAAEVAGLRQSGNGGLNTALDAMRRSANEARDRAAAAELKANTLKSVTNNSEEDPNITAALGEASGVSTQSLTDRLAALKNRT